MSFFIQIALLLLCKILTSKKDLGFCFVFRKGDLWAFLVGIVNSLVYVIWCWQESCLITFSHVCTKLACHSMHYKVIYSWLATNILTAIKEIIVPAGSSIVQCLCVLYSSQTTYTLPSLKIITNIRRILQSLVTVKWHHITRRIKDILYFIGKKHCFIIEL